MAESMATAAAARKTIRRKADRENRRRVCDMVSLRVADCGVETTGIRPLRLRAVPGKLINGAIGFWFFRRVAWKSESSDMPM